MIYRFVLAQVGEQVNILLKNCKQKVMLLSLLVGTTIGKALRTLVDIAEQPLPQASWCQSVILGTDFSIPLSH